MPWAHDYSKIIKLQETYMVKKYFHFRLDTISQ